VAGHVSPLEVVAAHRVGGAERVMHALMNSELQNARDDAGKRPWAMRFGTSKLGSRS